MRRYLGLIALGLLLATSASASVTPQSLVLDPGATATAPELRVLSQDGDRMTLEFTLPALDAPTIDVDGESFRALAIPGGGGGLVGTEGRAGLPTFSRLVAVPNGVAVTARVTDQRVERFDDIRPLPLQPADAKSLVMDRSWYADGRADALPVVEVGAPAVMHGLRVVPVSVNPVSYDPATGVLSATSRVEVELDLTGSDSRAFARHRDIIPESFDRIFQDTVAGYRAGDAQVGPGTYLVIVVNDNTVLNIIEPLLQWRREQGYNVVVETNGASSTSVIKSSIQSHYDNDDPPLEFVTIVGDATGTYGVDTWHESYSGYGGEGDHEYTLLEGGDWIADVNLGRLSFDSTSQLTGIVNKILTYEQNPPTTDSGWFTRGATCGDPSSSGITCVWVNQWLADKLYVKGYDSVTEIYSGNYATQMIGAVNQGLSAFGYRGYWMMSGLSESGILSMNNGNELPFAVIVTCDTGSFEDPTCRSEAFLKNTNGGGIGAVGTATTGTHTRYNNCYFMGAWEGMLDGSDHRLGVSHTRGKLELYNNYINYEDTRVYIWSTWNNLMGDPATDMWMAYPTNLTVAYPTVVPLGANSVPVHVAAGGALEGALVSLYKDGELRAVAYTDASGDANLPLPTTGLSAGTVNVTVTKHNCLPHRGTLTLGSVGTYLAFGASTTDDDTAGDSNGNGDGLANPGEAIELPVALRNFGTTAATNVSATLTSTDPYVTIVDGSETYGTIGAGATVWCAEDFDVLVATNAPDNHVIRLDLTAQSGVATWTSQVNLPVVSGAFELQSSTWSAGGTLDPGESGTMSATLLNVGGAAASAVTGVLSTDNPWITITDPNGSFGSVGVGGTGQNGADPFGFSISPDCFQGALATFQLTLTFDGVREDVVEFSLPVGTASSDDPLGPDVYGYWAFDNTDTTYPFAPTYQWVDISGVGTDIGLSDFGWEQDETVVVNLPFTFRYYGEEFTQISVCSNGWIAMGVVDMQSYRNWTIPGAGNPHGMIAGFFDNLYASSTNQILTWYDSTNARFVIEYNGVRNDYSNALERFEIILMDPAVHATVTGDGPILMQYETVGNTDSRDGYASVGIQSPDGNDGLLYTYASDYPAAAAPLATGRAILFQPVGDLALGTLQGMLSNSSNGDSPVSGVTVRLLENNQSLLSGSDGHYAGGVQAGTYTAQVNHESFETVTVPGVNVVEDQVTNLDFDLVDILGPYLENVTIHPHTEDTVGPYLIEANITDFSAIATMHLYYKLNGGGLFEAPLTLLDAQTGLYEGAIPGLPLSTHVSYWFEAEDAVGNGSRNPVAPDTYYDFYVTDVVVLAANDMETDPGWTVGQAGDNATTGIWTRVDPIGVYAGGTPVQPEDDVTPDPGVNCWITGNNETGAQGADDVDDGQTTLLTPVYDLSDMLSATVTYYRWYSNDTGNSPDEDYWTVEVTSDGSNWVQLEHTNVSLQAWTQFSFVLEDYVALTGTVQLRFVASDFNSGSVVEAGVDEFTLTGFAQPDPTAVDDGAVPAGVTLLQNVPNPFNPTTEIRFGLPGASATTLKVYDTSGRLVRTLLANAPLAAGFHRVSWDGADARGHKSSSGLYFYVLEADGQRQTGKMTLLK